MDGHDWEWLLEWGVWCHHICAETISLIYHLGILLEKFTASIVMKRWGIIDWCRNDPNQIWSLLEKLPSLTLFCAQSDIIFFSIKNVFKQHFCLNLTEHNQNQPQHLSDHFYILATILGQVPKKSGHFLGTWPRRLLVYKNIPWNRHNSFFSLVNCVPM